MLHYSDTRATLAASGSLLCEFSSRVCTYLLCMYSARARVCVCVCVVCVCACARACVCVCVIYSSVSNVLIT